MKPIFMMCLKLQLLLIFLHAHKAQRHPCVCENEIGKVYTRYQREKRLNINWSPPNNSADLSKTRMVSQRVHLIYFSHTHTARFSPTNCPLPPKTLKTLLNFPRDSPVSTRNAYMGVSLFHVIYDPKIDALMPHFPTQCLWEIFHFSFRHCFPRIIYIFIICWVLVYFLAFVNCSLTFEFGEKGDKITHYRTQYKCYRSFFVRFDRFCRQFLKP